MELFTDRLKLVPFTLTDANLFLEINTDPFVRKYLWDDETIDLATATEILETNRSLFRDQNYGLWQVLLKESDIVCGYVGLWFFFDESQPQLLYALLEPYTGQGYAKEASQKVIQYAFDQLGFSYLVAATDEPHLASQKVALSLGMKYVETRLENDKPTLFYRIDKP